jgi:alkanesulfonate monooxygenase SsuD/methylene tetrahydromethanopterin reductase-like flavin-dependent oxidoreductase (luciferase family)
LKSSHSLSDAEVDWVVARLPRELVEDLTVAGDVGQCVARLRGMSERGVEEVAILPFAPSGGNLRDMVDLLLTEVAPQVNRRS